MSDTDEPECKATNAYGGLGDLEAFCGGFYEIDLNFQGGRVYLYQEVTALLAGGVYDVCDKLADSDQQLGRCLLAFLSSFEVDDQYEDHWEKYTQGRRWEDFLGEIREVQRAARFDESECLTVDGKRGPFGSTNWTTRGSDNKHCQAGPDLLEELRESDPELDDALGNDFDLNEWLPDQIPENGDLSDVEALLDRLEDYGLGLADIGLDRDRLIDGLSEALQPWERTQNCYVLVICDPPQDFVEEDD